MQPLLAAANKKPREHSARHDGTIYRRDMSARYDGTIPDADMLLPLSARTVAAQWHGREVRRWRATALRLAAALSIYSARALLAPKARMISKNAAR